MTKCGFPRFGDCKAAPGRAYHAEPRAVADETAGGAARPFALDRDNLPIDRRQAVTTEDWIGDSCGSGPSLRPSGRSGRQRSTSSWWSLRQAGEEWKAPRHAA